MTVAALAPKPNPQLMPHRGNLAGHERREWRFYPEPGHTKEQILAPEYWAHFSKQFRHGDKVEVFCEDGSFYAELLVVGLLPGAVKMFPLQWHAVASEVPKDGQFDTTWKGTIKKFCVVRKADGTVVHDGLQSREEAAQWLVEHKSTLT